MRQSIADVPSVVRGTARNTTPLALGALAYVASGDLRGAFVTAAVGLAGWAVKKGAENHRENQHNRAVAIYQRELAPRVEQAVSAVKARGKAQRVAWDRAAVEEWRARGNAGDPPHYVTTFTADVYQRLGSVDPGPGDRR